MAFNLRNFVVLFFFILGLFHSSFCPEIETFQFNLNQSYRCEMTLSQMERCGLSLDQIKQSGLIPTSHPDAEGTL